MDKELEKSNSFSNSEMLGWRLSDNGFFPLGRRVLGDNDQREMELINVLGGHILKTHCNLSKQTVPALSPMSGVWREKGNELFQECGFPWAGAEAVRENARGLSWVPRSALRGAVQRQVVGVLWQMNHVKWTECWKQKLQKALNFSLTALGHVIRTNYLGLKGFGGFSHILILEAEFFISGLCFLSKDFYQDKLCDQQRN